MSTQQHTTIITSLLLITFLFWTVPLRAHVGDHRSDSEAAMEYRIFLEFKPGDFTTRIKLAMILLNQDKLEKAEKEFNLALTDSPMNPQAYLGLSLLKLKQHQINAALEFIKKAIEIEPDNPVAHLNYGLILEAANRPLEAQNIYRDGLAKLAQKPENQEIKHDRQQLENALQKIVDKLTKIDTAN